MDEKLRLELLLALKDAMFEYYSDKSTIRYIIEHGINIKGTQDMTDEELIDEYRELVLYGDEYEDDDNLLEKAKASMAIGKIFSE